MVKADEADRVAQRNERINAGLQVTSRFSRSSAQRDRDRLIYTSALRRLAGVTQVVGPLEGHVFHNRLTHTHKVAQVAQRLAQRLASKRKAARAWGGIDPDVVEAAALAHDLGHPPFGHVAEHELDRLVKLAGDPEGYEGNAQSFRILTRLASHKTEYEGLDLTRATLNAVLKYPWARRLNDTGHKRYRKFGYYTSEQAYFDFARSGYVDDRQSVEAAIMDVSDSIAYSVHDLDDFFRAGLVPLYLLRFSDAEFEAFMDAWKESLKPGDDVTVADIDVADSRSLFRTLLEFWPTDRQYVGSQAQRRDLSWAASKLIDRYVRSIRIGDAATKRDAIVVPQKEKLEMAFLQRIVRAYVIDDARLATQQAGQRKVIAYLYSTYHRAIKREDLRLLPAAYGDSAKVIPAAAGPQRTIARARLAADIVASFSDNQANMLFRRLTGVNPGSVMDVLEG